MFDQYNVQPRMLDGMFSVMLCNKEVTKKIMEDFSCNGQIVEIPSYQTKQKETCRFEDNWKELSLKYCPRAH
jgi:hypothetical protein